MVVADLTKLYLFKVVESDIFVADAPQSQIILTVTFRTMEMLEIAAIYSTACKGRSKVIMKNTALGVMKIVAVGAVFIGAPVAAAVITARPAQETPAVAVPVTSAALSSALVATITQTEVGLAGGLPEADKKTAFLDALEAAIASSGATPEVAIDALTQTQASMTASGKLTSAGNAAIEDLLARVRAFLKLDDQPSSLGGDTGRPAFGAPPTTEAGGGGSDYRSAQ